MARMIVKKFTSPDETRPFEKGRAEILSFGEGVVGRGTFQPGWRWSSHVKPIAGTRSCEAAHVGYVASGRMHVAMDDGQEMDIGPGDYCIIPPGHDAWVIGDEACVIIDVAGMGDYAKRSGANAEGGHAEQHPSMHH